MATWRLSRLVLAMSLATLLLVTPAWARMATPEADENARWLADPADLECITDPEALPGAVAPGWRAYPLDSEVLPFSEARPEDRETVAEVFLALQACVRNGSPEAQDAFFSGNAVLMPPPDGVRVRTQGRSSTTRARPNGSDCHATDPTSEGNRPAV